MLFSQRKGLKSVKSVMQVDSMDDDLRTGLWNCLNMAYWEEVNPQFFAYNEEMHNLLRRLWLNYFKEPLETIPTNWRDALATIRKYFFDCEWYEVYDLIEFISKSKIYHEHIVKQFMDNCNIILEREASAYRFVGGEITQITSEEEIAAIEEALGKSTPLKPVYIHLKTALDFLSDRKKPDYRNSIKESISAVEAISRLITKNHKATLGQALKIIKDKVGLHSALEKAFENMYGYTSDKDGIRHSLLDKSALQFIDAKFMLVSCSAFVNYLIDKAGEASIKI